MPVTPATAALKAELTEPSIPGAVRGTIAAMIKTQRPALLPLLAQVAAIEALLFEAIEDEMNEKVHGKYESARQTMAAFRRYVQSIDDQQHKLSVALRNWEREKADILRVIAEEE